MRLQTLAAVLAVVSWLPGCTSSEPPGSRETARVSDVETHKAVIRRWIAEAHEKRNLAVIDEIYTPDYRGHINGDSIDKEQGRQMELAFQSEFPAHRVTIDDLFGEQDRVVTRWTMSATHKSGKDVVMRGISISRFEGGRIAEEWMVMDNAAALAALGAQP
jgi:predicted ester cyclase